MTHSVNDNEPIVISEEDAKGGEVTKRGNFEDSLVPMLVGVIVLTVIGVSVVALIAAVIRG
jgi:hypothetical protein